MPHRSLGRRGLVVVATAICLFSALISTGLLLLGAWPVIGFNGLEVGLALWLLRRHARDTKRTELVTLTDTELHITRTDRSGQRSSVSLPIGWLQVVVSERQGRIPALLLVQRGVQHEIGAELGEAEKLDLAQALRAALNRARHPQFDNAQLRENGASPVQGGLSSA